MNGENEPDWVTYIKGFAFVTIPVAVFALSLHCYVYNTEGNYDRIREKACSIADQNPKYGNDNGRLDTLEELGIKVELGLQSCAPITEENLEQYVNKHSKK